ncbi:hypothetical protein GW17_00047423, partial [Ensete ventricosum]
MHIVVPLTSSAYHLELNLKSLAKNAGHALMAVVKEITENHVDTSEFSDASFKTDFKAGGPRTGNLADWYVRAVNIEIANRGFKHYTSYVIRIYQHDQILQDKRLPVGTSALLKLE